MVLIEHGTRFQKNIPMKADGSATDGSKGGGKTKVNLPQEHTKPDSPRSPKLPSTGGTAGGQARINGQWTNLGSNQGHRSDSSNR